MRLSQRPWYTPDNHLLEVPQSNHAADAADDIVRIAMDAKARLGKLGGTHRLHQESGPRAMEELPPPLASIAPRCDPFTIPIRPLTVNRRFPRWTAPARRRRKPYPSWASETTGLKVTRSIGAWVSFLHWWCTFGGTSTPSPSETV